MSLLCRGQVCLLSSKIRLFPKGQGAGGLRPIREDWVLYVLCFSCNVVHCVCRDYLTLLVLPCGNWDWGTHTKAVLPWLLSLQELINYPLSLIGESLASAS